MSEEKPPRRPLFQRLFNKFFHQTLKPRAQLMQALEEAEDNLVIDPYSRSVIEGAMQVESLKVRDVMVPRSKMIIIDSESTVHCAGPSMRKCFRAASGRSWSGN